MKSCCTRKDVPLGHPSFVQKPFVKGSTKNSFESTKFRNEGNVLLKDESQHSYWKHKEILLLYTKSAAFALNNSEQLAMAYSNRSVLLKHLKKYKFAIIDIDLSLKITKSPSMIVKLLARKIECLRHIGDTKTKVFAEVEKYLKTFDDNEEFKNQLLNLLQKKNEFENLEPLDIYELVPFGLPKLKKKSKEIPCISNALKLNYNKNHGRHLVANRDIKTGEILVIAENYVAYPDLDKIYIVCSYCLKLTWNGIPCDSCVFTIYCSVECKKKAWQKFHDIECAINPYLLNIENFMQTFEFIKGIRLLIIALKENGIENGLEYVVEEAEKVDNNKDERTKGFSDDGKMYYNKFRACYGLQSNADFYPPNLRANWEMGTTRVLRLLKDYTDVFENVCKRKSEAEVNKMIHKLREISIKVTNGAFVNNVDDDCWICDCRDGELHNHNCTAPTGVVCAPGASFINHSCIPNVIRVTNAGRVIVFAIHPIKKDQELFVANGVHMYVPKPERQKYLKTGYKFDCDCQACDENWPIETKYTIELKTARASSKEIHHLHSILHQAYWKWPVCQELLDEFKVKIDNIYATSKNNYAAEKESFIYKEELTRLLLVYYGVGFPIPNIC